MEKISNKIAPVDYEVLYSWKLTKNIYIYIYIYFFIRVLFHEHSRITGLQRKGEGISLSPSNHFHPLHRHLEISRTVTAESSPLPIASTWTRIGNFDFRAQVANH